jgi:hypothetical protein
MNDRCFLKGLEAIPEGRPATGLKSTSRILEGLTLPWGSVEPWKGIGCGGGPGRQKKAPERGPGLENAMRVVLVRRGATQEAYPDRGGSAIPGAT